MPASPNPAPTQTKHQVVNSLFSNQIRTCTRGRQGTGGAGGP